jgi:addiction module HigA family antidote
MGRSRPAAPVHPGEVLKAEFPDEIGVSAYALAKALCVPTNRVTAIINGERAITAETALRLARFFGTTDSFWMNLQSNYELAVARQKDAARIHQEVNRHRPARAASKDGARNRRVERSASKH